ncbi:hypothetical protein SRHO_G00048140 [Serrasalmus rhombeus]
MQVQIRADRSELRNKACNVNEALSPSHTEHSQFMSLCKIVITKTSPLLLVQRCEVEVKPSLPPIQKKNGSRLPGKVEQHWQEIDQTIAEAKSGIVKTGHPKISITSMLTLPHCRRPGYMMDTGDGSPRE